MTVQDMPADAGDIQRPAANVDLDDAQHANTTAGTSTDAGRPEEPIAKLKREEVVFVVREPGASGVCLIYSLSEGSTSDGGNPFSLGVVRCPQHQLPEDLSDFLVDRDSLPPPHLRSPRQVHVVVSTHSGLRLAQDFDQHVLRPLLGAVGLRQSESGDGGYQVTVTRDSNTIRDFARELGKDEHAGEKTILLVSGDGGIVDLLNGLDHSSPSSSPSPPPPPTIALLPLGTANALFHSLHKPHYARPAPTPSPLTLALRTLLKGTTAPLPTFKASFSPGAKLVSAPVDPTEEQHHHQLTETTTTPIAAPPTTTPIPHLIGAIVASYGFHASLVWESDTPAYRAHGDARFKMAAAELLRVGHAYTVGVEVRRGGGSDAFSAVGRVGVAEGGGGGGGGGGGDYQGGGGDGDGDRDRDDDADGEGREKRGGSARFNYVLATLVSNLEKTFAISPAGRPLDGVLRLVHFGDVGGERTMEIMMAAYREGGHVGMPDVGYEEVEEVRVTIQEEDARWRKVCVDGSVVEVEQGGWMGVQREKRERLRVLVDRCVAR